MKLRINPNNPFGLKEQIKQQLKKMVETGLIRPGDALPSAKDLAALLKVNRNTAAAAYGDLVSEGLLRSKRGSGTFVREDVRRTDLSGLDEIFDRAEREAKERGYPWDRVAEYMINRAQEQLNSAAGKRVLVVECNREGLDDLAGVLIRELGVEVEKALIQDLEQDPARAKSLSEWADMVVCGFNHVREFKEIVPDPGKEIVGVLLKPDLRILNQVLNLKKGTRVGFVCVNQRSTETLYQETVFASSSALVRILAGLDRPEAVRELLEKCEMVYVTNYAHERVRQLAGPGRRLIKVDLTIDPANVSLVREKLAYLKRRD